MREVWLEEELAILRQFYPTEGSPGVHQRTGRSIKAIQIQAKKQGLKVLPEGIQRINSACGMRLHSPPHRANRETVLRFMYENGII